MSNNYNQKFDALRQSRFVKWIIACSFMLLSLFVGSSAYSQCSGIPSSAGTASAVSTTICYGTSASLSVAGASNDLGIVYQWYSSAVLGGPYTTLESGATDTLFTSGALTANRYFVLSVKCSNTGDSVLTNEVAISIDNSPLVGTYTIGSPASCTQFTSIANFVSQINTRGISGAVVLNVPAGYNELLTAGLVMTATGTITNTITIQKSGAGLNPMLTAFVGSKQASSTTTIDAMWSFVGSDYVTIDGIDLLDPVTNTTDITTMEVGYGFYKASGTDGTNNNTVKNCTITLNRVNWTTATGPRFQGSVGIEVMACNSNTVGTTTTVTSIDGASSNNKFYSNTIQNVNTGIALSGFAGATPFTLCDFNNDIGGSALSTGNNIINFGGGVGATNACAAVFLKDQWSANVSYNTVDNNVGGTGGFNHPATNRGIFANNSSVGSSCNITNNNITIVAGTSTSAITWCIDYEAGQSGANGNTVNINNNTISATNAAASTAAFTAIWVNTASSTVNVNNNNITKFAYAGTGVTECILSQLAGIGTLNINDNTMSNVSTTAATGSHYNIGVTATVTTALNINGNTSNGISVSNATSKILRVYYVSVSATTAAHSISNNTLSNISWTGGTPTGEFALIYAGGSALSWNINSNTLTGSMTVPTTGTVYFIYNSQGTSSGTVSNNNFAATSITRSGASGATYGYYNASSPTGTFTFSGNTFGNFTTTGTGLYYGIYLLTSTSCRQVLQNNSFSNISIGSGILYGINHNYGNTNSEISGNTVTGLSGTGTVAGINIGATASLSLNVFNNTVSGITTTGASSTVSGILHSAGANSRIYQNKIYNINANSAGSTAIGLNVTGGTTTHLYNNIIGDIKTTASSGANPVIGISVTGGTTHNVSFNSVYLTGTSSGAIFGSSAISVNATPTTITLRNNIFINATTPKSTGIATAYRRSSTVLTNFGASSNNNLYYSGTPSSTKVILFDGTNAYQTLPIYKIAMATRDQAAVTENPTFLSTVSSNSNYLHIDPAVATFIEGGATNVAGITTDYDSQIRAGNAGSTFLGTNPDIGADEGDFPSLNPTVLSATSTLPTQQCAPIDRTISASVDAGGASLTGVVLNYSYDGVAQTAIAMSGGTSTGISTWTALLPSGSAASGTLVTWSVVATNSIGSGGAIGLAFTDKTPTIATNPTTQTVCPNAPTTLGIASASGNSILLNGTSQYVEVASNSGLASTTSMTLEAWIKPAGFNTFAGIISKY